MPEQYRDWIPPGQKPPWSSEGQYRDWVPPDGWIAEEARVGTVAVPPPPPATEPEVPTSPPTPVATREGTTYHCRDCKEPFESLGLLLRHRREAHTVAENG